MNEFIKLIGDTTLGQTVLVLIAFTWVVGKAKEVYHWIITGHTKEQAKERVVMKLDEYEKGQALLKQGMGALLQYRLIAECERMIAQKYVTYDDIELLNNLYHPYHAMGFNGVGTKYFNACSNLPIKEEKE